MPIAHGNYPSTQLLDRRLHAPHATMATMLALALRELQTPQLHFVIPSKGFYLYDATSTATVDGTSVLVPDAIAASADYISDPATAPGRFLFVAGSVGDGTISGLSAPQFAKMTYTDPAAASTTGLKAAAPSSTSAVNLTRADLIAGGLTTLAAYPRRLSVTVGGGTAGDAPASVDITYIGIDGETYTETVAPNLSGGTVYTDGYAVGFPSTGTIYAFDAGTGTDATVALGWGAELGLLAKAVDYGTNVLNVQKEIAVGAVVTTGTFKGPAAAPPYGSYEPASAANGSRDYTLVVEV